MLHNMLFNYNQQIYDIFLEKIKAKENVPEEIMKQVKWHVNVGLSEFGLKNNDVEFYQIVRKMPPALQYTILKEVHKEAIAKTRFLRD